MRMPVYASQVKPVPLSCIADPIWVAHKTSSLDSITNYLPASIIMFSCSAFTAVTFTCLKFAFPVDSQAPALPLLPIWPRSGCSPQPPVTLLLEGAAQRLRHISLHWDSLWIQSHCQAWKGNLSSQGGGINYTLSCRQSFRHRFLTSTADVLMKPLLASRLLSTASHACWCSTDDRRTTVEVFWYLRSGTLCLIWENVCIYVCTAPWNCFLSNWTFSPFVTFITILGFYLNICFIWSLCGKPTQTTAKQ